MKATRWCLLVLVTSLSGLTLMAPDVGAAGMGGGPPADVPAPDLAAILAGLPRSGVMDQRFAHVPEIPAQAPRPPWETGRASGPAGPEVHPALNSCYPAGHEANIANDCLNPGYWVTGGNPMRWGNEPFYGTNHRYVWVVDELGGRAREWLQYIVNQWNSIAPTASTNRPYVLYYTAEQAGAGWANCDNNQNQTIEFCWRENGTGRSSAHPAAYLNGILARGDGWISANATSSDQYLEYSIAHEYGHLWGAFHHNQDCDSVMTYCTLHIGVDYMWYHGDDTTVYVNN